MVWESPHYLPLLWIGLLLIPGLLLARRQASGRLRRLLSRRMQQQLAADRRGGRILSGWLCLTAATGFGVVALAGPQYGLVEQQVSSRGIDVFILLDVSRSMLAEDVRPSRLDRARSDIRDLLSRLEGDRVGLITFAGAANVAVPLTTDQNYFRLILDEVDPLSASRGGTQIGDAIRLALDAMPRMAGRDQAIVLITDGEDQGSSPNEAAATAAARRIPIITVGLGDDGDGARIPIRDEQASPSFLRHDGREVWSRMDSQLLQEIAAVTDGAWIPARTLSYDLGQIYEQRLAGLTSGDLKSSEQEVRRRQFQWFLAAAVLFCFPALWSSAEGCS